MWPIDSLLNFGVKNKSTWLCRFALFWGADTQNIDETTGNKLLGIASSDKGLALVLTKKKAQLGGNEETVLHYLIRDEKFTEAKEIINSLGQDDLKNVNIKDNRGFTPLSLLHYFAPSTSRTNNNSEIIQKLGGFGWAYQQNGRIPKNLQEINGTPTDEKTDEKTDVVVTPPKSTPGKKTTSPHNEKAIG